MSAVVDLISTSGARAALLARVRECLGYSDFPIAVWNSEVESETLVRLFAADSSYGADGEAEAPMSGELPAWQNVRWERIADRLGVRHDGTREGARSALKDEALLRTRLSAADFFERGENAVVLLAAPFVCAIQDLPPGHIELPLDWEIALVESDQVPWRQLYTHLREPEPEAT